MSDKNVAKHSLRLSLRNEQHLRIQRVLSELNKEIYKSENQFIINALDFYIQSFENDDMMRAIQKKPKAEFVTRDDLSSFRMEVISEVKNELIRLLGSAMIGGQSVPIPASRVADTHRAEPEEQSPIVTDLANQWG